MGRPRLSRGGSLRLLPPLQRAAGRARPAGGGVPYGELDRRVGLVRSGLEGTTTQQQRGTPAASGTRERIVEAAIDVFAEKGYHRAAVDDIVARSGTSKGSFYHFFPSKEGIFLGLLERLSGVLLARVERDLGTASGGLARVDAALSATFATFEEHRSLARILLVEAPALGRGADARLFEVHRRFAEFIARRLDEARQDGSIPEMDTELAAYAWLGAVQQIVVRWLHTGKPEPLRAAVPELRALLLRSVGATG